MASGDTVSGENVLSFSFAAHFLSCNKFRNVLLEVKFVTVMLLVLNIIHRIWSLCFYAER